MNTKKDNKIHICEYVTYNTSNGVYYKFSKCGKIRFLKKYNNNFRGKYLTTY